MLRGCGAGMDCELQESVRSLHIELHGDDNDRKSHPGVIYSLEMLITKIKWWLRGLMFALAVSALGFGLAAHFLFQNLEQTHADSQALNGTLNKLTETVGKLEGRVGERSHTVTTIDSDSSESK